MPPWLRSVSSYLFSEPLYSFWGLFIGFFVGCYFVAWALFKLMPRNGVTIVSHARRVWGFAFLLHAVVSTCVLLPWYLGNRMLAGFASFFAFYCVLLVIDLIAGIGLVISARRFQTYRQFR